MITVPAHMTVPLTRPVLGAREELAVLDVLRSGWLVQGPKVAEFESAVAAYVGAEHAVATSSGTTALHLALVLHGIGPGDEVIVPSLSFIATANAVVHAGATPVFVDVHPRTHNIDPIAAEAAVTPRTRAIVPVHQLGLAADMDRVTAVARRHGLVVVEDAAAAIGAAYKGRRVGGLGNTACFSFHPRKAITTAEGGMVVTDDPELADRARALRAHGMSVSAFARHTAGGRIVEEYHELGYNYRMSDLHAALGLAQITRLDAIIDSRRTLAKRYAAALAAIPDIALPPCSNDAPHTYQSFMITLTPDSRVDRDLLGQALSVAGVATRRGVMAAHLEPYYRARFPDVRLPVTEYAARRALLLPMYSTMTGVEQEYVVVHLRRALADAVSS